MRAARMSAAGPKLSALILAGRRPGPPDSLEAAEGVAHKALIDIAGALVSGRLGPSHVSLAVNRNL